MRYFTIAAGLCAVAAISLGGCASRPKAPPAAVSNDLGQHVSPVTEAPPGPAGEAFARGSQADLAANAGDRIYFALDSQALDEEARAVLRRQAAWLAVNPSVRARIAGNADERGTREYNLALGARRAEAARRFLIGLGVSAERLQTISYGKERPVDPRSDEAGWAINRNAQTVVIGIAES